MGNNSEGNYIFKAIMGRISQAEWETNTDVIQF